MDFKEHVVLAWNLTLKHIVSLVLMTLVMLGISIVTLGILAPVTMAGYVQSILTLIRTGREPKIQDLFTQMRLFLPLLAFGVVVLILVSIGFMLFVLPGLIIALGVTFCCIYMIPLMTDRDLGIFDAVKQSYRMTTTGPLADNVVVVIIFWIISMIGGSVFIGILFTQPLATLFLISVYEEKLNLSVSTQQNTSSTLNE
jgi:uncharacterized membrane protein